MGFSYNVCVKVKPVLDGIPCSAIPSLQCVVRDAEQEINPRFNLDGHLLIIPKYEEAYRDMEGLFRICLQSSKVELLRLHPIKRILKIILHRCPLQHSSQAN